MRPNRAPHPWFALAIALVSLAVVAQAVQSTPPPREPSWWLSESNCGVSRIRGTVLGERDGSPIEGAMVKLKRSITLDCLSMF